MPQRFKPQKFNQPYTVPDKGRGEGTSFKESRPWHQKYALIQWNIYKENQPRFMLVWADPATSKTHYSIAWGEATPWQGNCLFVVHTNNITDQHTSVLEHYKQTGYVEKNWKSCTIHSIYKLIEKIKKDKKLSESDVELRDFIYNTNYLIADECHKYGKNMGNSKTKGTKMLDVIQQHLFSKGNLKLIVGTSATARNINQLWNIFGSFVDRDYYTIKPTDKEIKEEGYKPVPVQYLKVDTKTTLFDMSSIPADMLDRLEDPELDEYCTEILDTSDDPNITRDLLSDENHKLKFRKLDDNKRIEFLSYLDNRTSVAIDHYLKHYKGESAIINVRGVLNAKYYVEKYKDRIGNLEMEFWNGLAKSGKDANSNYKDNEEQLLEDLCNRDHPLKILFTNGMLREGTNKPIDVTYQCAFTASEGGAETSVQIGHRSKKTVILVDAMNIRDSVGKSTGNYILDCLIEQGSSLTPAQIEDLAKITQMEQMRGEATNKTSDESSIIEKITNKNKEELEGLYQGQNETDDGVGYCQVGSPDIWVRDVEYVGNLKATSLKAKFGHQNLIDAIDIGYEFKEINDLSAEEYTPYA